MSKSKMCEENEFTMENLPSELLFKILSYLEIRDLITMKRVSRKLREISTDPSFWRKIDIHPFKNSIGYVRSISKHCPRLEELKFTKKNRVGIKHTRQLLNFFAGCEFLQRLHLHAANVMIEEVTDLVASSFPRLKDLTILTFDSLPPVSEKCLMHLTRLESLEKLQLNVHCSCVQVLKTVTEKLGNLKELRLKVLVTWWLSETTSNVDHLNSIIESNRDKLKLCSISGANISELTDQLSRCRNLQELVVSGGMTDSSLASFQKLENLKRIHIRHLGRSGVTASGLAKFFVESASLQNLESVILVGSNLCYRGLVAMAKNCPNLRHLDLTNQWSIDSGIIPILTNFKKLVSLELPARGFSWWELIEIPVQLPGLRRLKLSVSSFVDRDRLQHVMRELAPRLDVTIFK